MVLKYCINIDVNLDISKVKEILQNRCGTNNYDILEYDAVVNSNTLIQIIISCSSMLNKLRLLNSQGGCDSHGSRYKIQAVKEVLEESETSLLESIIKNFNLELLNTEQTISREQVNQFIDIQFQSRGKLLSRKEKILLQQNRNDIKDLANRHDLEFNTVNQSIEKRCEDYKVVQMNVNKITDQSNFYPIQSELLKTLNLANFSDISIGTYLSENADESSYVCDKNFGEIIDVAIKSIGETASEY